MITKRSIMALGFAGLMGFAALGSSLPVNWPKALFTETPRVWDYGTGMTNDVRMIFYENVPYRGRPTRCFAYLGLPTVTPGQKVPAVVLVHGGGGSAFYRWVKHWTSRGYAAIAMDHEGCVSGNVFGQAQCGHRRHEWSGPAQGAHDWMRMNEPVEDQWTYHAVASILRAHTLLRSLPEVDAARIGLTGISWGGFLSCIAAGVDARFAFVAPVYGCGFITEHSMWLDKGFSQGLACVPRRDVERYGARWDPKNYLPFAKMPFLFLDGTNDRAYPLDSVEKSRALLTGPVTRVTIPRLSHGHGAVSECPREVFAFADGIVGRGPKLARAKGLVYHGDWWSDCFRATYALEGDTIAAATLDYTLDSGDSRSRVWKATPATVSNDTVIARIPAHTTGFFLTAKTARGYTVTTDAILSPTKIAGVETLVDMAPTKANIRNGEGDTVMLKDGRMLFAWSHFQNRMLQKIDDGGGSDHYAASIYKLVSPDGGKTWPKEPVEMIPNDGGLNLMCVSFLRMRDGKLGIFYLKKNSTTDCRPWMRVSADEGETWSAPRPCVPDDRADYYVVNNARVVRLKSGRILIPMARHTTTNGKKDWLGRVTTAWSDDDGATWKMAASSYATKRPDGTRNAAHEPGLVELKDGRVMMNIRSYCELMYVCYSSDGGETWTTPEVALGTTPETPATLARLSSGELVMVYNDHATRTQLGNRRTPLVICVSEDEGRTWTRHRAIVDDLSLHSLCYTSIREQAGKLYLSYYSRNGLTWLSLVSVPIADVLSWENL